MGWPTPQEYNEAVQNPQHNFQDDELRRGVLDLTPIGLPRVASGAFASVYRVRAGNRDYAVRCFLTDTPDQAERYSRISRYVMTDDLPYTVNFQHIADGVRVQGKWYPLVKMEWVQGESLDSYVRRHLWDTKCIAKLAADFKQMVLDLKKGGIAHGDLQHGNIIVTRQSELRLVDYDGMFVPELQGFASNEIGHRNYQHPARDRQNFDATLDNFSAWSIYTSLLSLSKDPRLVEPLSGCDECLLFRQKDYRYPLRSHAFHVLETHNDPEIRTAARNFRSLLDRSLDLIPSLDEDVHAPDSLPEVIYSEVAFNADGLPTWVVDVSPEVLDSEAPEVETPSNWPKLIEYINAVATPAKNFTDDELRNSVLALDHGQIRARTGDHGAVFRFHSESGREIAVKVFLKFDPNLEERYRRLHEYIFAGSSETARLQNYFVDFEFIPEGIKVNNSYFPILKMNWIDGQTLFEVIENSRTNRDSMRAISEQFVEMMEQLRIFGVVHGDLDAENIMMVGGRLLLLDYDRTVVPTSRALVSRWTRSLHFRHPLSKRPTDELTDNFQAWLIYASLVLLSLQPALFNEFSVKPGRLLFKREDLLAPANSFVFSFIRDHYSSLARSLGEAIKRYCNIAPNLVSPLSDKYLPASPMRTYARLTPRQQHIQTAMQKKDQLMAGQMLAGTLCFLSFGALLECALSGAPVGAVTAAFVTFLGSVGWLGINVNKKP